MKRRSSKVVKAVAMALITVMSMSVAGCTGRKTDGEVSDMKATIEVGYVAEYKEEFEAVTAAFNEKYPDIKVVPVEIPGAALGQITKMNALAASGKLPDICTGSEQLGYIVQQGWAYPLDNLIENDPDKDDILEMGLKNFTYGEHVYALPWKLQFNTLYINEDLLNTLNMDKPEYTWTVEEFVDMAKKATTDEYSGINHVAGNADQPTWGLEVKLMGAYLPKGLDMYGYNFETHSLDLAANNAWVQSHNVIKELRSIKGCVADELHGSSSDGMDDYEKKFGKDADALVSGKVLIGQHSTWEYATFAQSGFKFDCYPFPTASGVEENIQTHVDFAYMTTNCTEENYQAAYEYLKFMTHGAEGAKIQLDLSVKTFNENPVAFQIFIPASTNEEVLTAFDETPFADGIKYMFRAIAENPEKAQRADCDKLIPNFWNDIKQYTDEAGSSIHNDGADPAALVTDLQTKMNEAVANTWTYFEECLTKNKAVFYESHPWEQQ